MNPRLLIPLTLTAICFATRARADPCEAKVTGYQPGDQISGYLRYVGDGDSVCVGKSFDPATWVEIRIADFNAPELNEPGGKQAKAALERYRNRPARCFVTRGRNGSTRSYDRVIATCSVDGVPVRTLMTRAGIREGGR